MNMKKFLIEKIENADLTTCNIELLEELVDYIENYNAYDLQDLYHQLHHTFSKGEK